MVGKTEPEIKNLTVANQSVVSSVAAATGTPAGVSPLERMFSSMALALGGSATDQVQFGYSLFDKPTAPSLASIGDDYTLGPGDSFVLYLWGDPVDLKEISASYTITVDRNGFAFIPPAGQLSVWGQDLGHVRSLIKTLLDKRYKKLEMSLTLSTLRQFPVYVTGFAGSPGTVLASGADTVATILSRAGGIKKTGSLRNILVTRQGKNDLEKVELDFYDTLVGGKSVDLRVREGDSIFVPGIGPVVSLSGELKRPGIYELKGDMSIASALSLAGGSLPSARSAAVTLLRFGEAGKTLSSGDLSDKTFASGLATDGDFLLFGKVSDLLIGQTQISGPVKYAGRYDVKSFPSLKSVLDKSQILAETNLFYGRVYRMDPSGRDKSFAFAPSDVLMGKDIPLAEFDRVVLYRYDDTKIDPDFDRFPATLVVSGPVKYPGFYLYRDGITLSKLMADNALTLDANRWYAEIARKTASGAEEYFTFSPDVVLSGETDFTLSPLDRIRFAKRGTEAKLHNFNRFPQAVLLSGQILLPEVYALHPGMKLSEILTRDQILLDTNLNYAEIIRLAVDGKNEYFTFTPEEILSGSRDFELGPRDVIKLVKVGFSPAAPDFDRFSKAVQITGPVQFSGLYAWREGMKLSSLFSRALLRLSANRYYAEIVRPLDGGRYEYKTFAPREVESVIFDVELKAKDSVRLFSTAPPIAALGVKLSAEEGSDEKNKAADSATLSAQASPADQGADNAPDLSGSADVVIQSVQNAQSEGEAIQGADLERFLEVVTVTGSVRYIGPYARTPSLKLSSIIAPDQILEETNLDYAELTRLREDGSYEFFTFSPREVLTHTYDLELKARDAIRFAKKTLFGGKLSPTNVQKFSDVVQLTGQIARPEVYALLPGMKLSALLSEDQLLLDTNRNYAEIQRYKADGKDEYFTFRPGELLSGDWDFDLGPRDVVRFFKVGYNLATPDFDRYANAVQVQGAVRFGGLYAWREGTTLSSILSLAALRMDTNRYYAEVARPLGGGRFEYVTFAPREIASGAFDVELKPKDVIKLFTSAPALASKPGAKEGEKVAPEGSSGLLSVEALADGVPAFPTPEAPEAGEGTTGIDLTRPLEVVQVAGSIRYTGPYARTPQLNLSSIVTSEQLLEETNLEYAELTRLKQDGNYEYITFAPRDVVEGTFDLALRARDSIGFYKKTAFGGLIAQPNLDKFSALVQLIGAAARPELFALRPDMKLSNVLTRDQILLDTNLNYAEITRLKTDGKNEYITFRPSEVLDGSWDFDLGPRDVIKLVKVGYAPAVQDLDRFVNAVQLSGPAQFAGLYAWREDMRLSSLLAKAKPSLVINQVYAEVVRPLGGDTFEYLTFSPKEVASGIFDLSLKARDSVRLYTTVPTALVKQGAETPPAASMAATPVVAEAAVVPAETPSAEVPADLGRFLEVVTVSGAVRYSGPWARTPTLMISSVITADQMLEETNLDYAELTRLRDDGSHEYRTFAPKDVLERKFDLALRAKDSIRLVKKTTFGGTLAAANIEMFADLVQLIGQVARPEVFALRPGMKLSALLTKDQMLLDTNLNYAEIMRLKADGKNEYLTFRPGEVISGEWDLALGPRDQIRLVTVNYRPEMPDFDRYPEAILVTGPAQFSGIFAWKKSMKLSSVQAMVKPLLIMNQVYAEIVRPLKGGKKQTITFAPREVGSGVFDIELQPRDIIQYYSTLSPPVQSQTLGPVRNGTQNGKIPEASVEAQPAAASPSSATLPAAPPMGGEPSAPSSSDISPDVGFFLEIVNVTGVIRYVGPYARTPTLKLSSVVTSEQILQETNLDYAELTRRKPDGGWEFKSFSPREVLAGKVDMDLRAQDWIRFVNVGYLPEKPDFDHFGNAYAVVGSARRTGLYSTDSPKLLSEIITPEQVISTTYLYFAEIERWIMGGRIEYKTFSPYAVLVGLQDERIFPRDIIRLIPADERTQTYDFSRNPDTVLIKGTTRYPGRYAWYEGLRLSHILAEDDLLIETDTSYAEVRRRSMDSETILSFSPSNIVQGRTDVELQPRDNVIFYPKYNKLPVTASGEVQEPKVIPYYDNMEFSQVLRSVKLKIDLSSLKAVVTRTNGETLNIYLEEYLKRQSATQLVLQPGDAISFKQLLPEENLPIVTVRGAVQAPQSIEFVSGMRLADALQSAGGYDPRAYPKGIILIRRTAAENQKKQVDRIISQLEAVTGAGNALPNSTDTALSSAAAVVANLQIDLAVQRARLGSLKQMYKDGFGRISIDIPPSIEELARSSSNVVLERDDLIFVPTTPTYVLVSGEVSDQNVVAFRDGLTVRQAIAESGWLSNNADLQKTYIMRASGKLDSTEGKGFLFFRPSILKFELYPGDTVVVVAKSSKINVGWGFFKDIIDSGYKIMYTVMSTVSLLGL